MALTDSREGRNLARMFSDWDANLARLREAMWNRSAARELEAEAAAEDREWDSAEAAAHYDEAHGGGDCDCGTEETDAAEAAGEDNGNA